MEFLMHGYQFGFQKLDLSTKKRVTFIVWVHIRLQGQEMDNVPVVVAVVVEVVEGSVTGVPSEEGRIRSLSSIRG